MRVNGALMKSTAVNLGLLLVASVAGLALCEASLRLFYPKYRHVAEAQFHADAIRIWARTPNARDWMNHPDTRVTHSFHHNNLALRQHRDFSEADLAAATNIGVFGDSFTENVRMPVQYSFTEPLDYLLNQRGRRFNVLNFGVHAYGPGQSLLHYEHFSHAEALDHVLYVYCSNDLGDISHTGLFHLNEAGQLVRNEAIRESWWTPLIRRLHIAYLILDVSGRLSFFLEENERNSAYLRRSFNERLRDERREDLERAIHQGRPDDARTKNSLAIFRQLIRYWKHLAEQNGSTFSVVLLPSHPPQPFVVDLLSAEGVEVIDLFNCFGTHDPTHIERGWVGIPYKYDPTHIERGWVGSPYKFRKDAHWNEAGNRLASVCLYRVLEEKTGLPRLSEGRLEEILSRYYTAFERDLSEGGGALKTLAEIREKYVAFDMNTTLKKLLKEDFFESAAQPTKRIIASDFDVYLNHNRLISVKEHCSPADMAARFFLHVIPVDKRDLPKRWRRQGFERIRPRAQRVFRIGRYDCVALMKLPRYSVRYLRTGQYVPDEGRLWEGAAWIDSHEVGEERPEFPVAPGTRIINADFDVYLDDRQLVYHKADCGPTDREPPFFLQVTPIDETVLPRDRKHDGFDKFDFNPCTIERKLPAYAIRRIHTGQFVQGGRALWEAEFILDEANATGGGITRTPASQRTVRSVFDVTLDGRRLLFSKAECRPADRTASFFLHVTPVDETVLTPTRARSGFDNLDFRHTGNFKIDEFGCTTRRRLPPYTIRSIRTGQFVPDGGVLWEGESAMAQDVLGQD